MTCFYVQEKLKESAALEEKERARQEKERLAEEERENTSENIMRRILDTVSVYHLKKKKYTSFCLFKTLDILFFYEKGLW